MSAVSVDQCKSHDDYSILDESVKVEEFIGFSEDDVSSFPSDVGSLKDSTCTTANATSEFTDSDEDEDSCESIMKRQRLQMVKKKEMLQKLMKELDDDPTFLKMKMCSPQEWNKMHKKSPKKVGERHQYHCDPAVTRQRSGVNSLKLHGPLTKRSFLTVRYTSRKKLGKDDSKPVRRSYSHVSQARQIVAVEDVTPHMLSNIALHSVGKHYDAINGSCCHQCRQKTTDTKSCCRNKDCVGVRGQFCGPCLKNRYGENVKDALLDPEWKCPVCQGFCNCSICRNRNGKCATGILIGFARQRGFNNVKDYLQTLGNEESDE